MKIDHLREFVYLAETLNYNITAKHFFISVSALSKHIDAMESYLGVSLLDRGKHSVCLTSTGKIFYEDCITLLHDWDHALIHLSSARSAKPHLVRVGYLRGAAQPFLATFLRYMEKNEPDVNVQLACMEYGELIRAHRSHEVDIIFSMDLDPEAIPTCDFFNIYQDKLYVIVAKGHPLAKCAEAGIDLESLKCERLMLPMKSHYVGYNEFLETFVSDGLCSAETLYYRDIDTLYMRVEAGDCVGFSSGHHIGRLKDRVTFLSVRGVDTTYGISARWLKSMDPSVLACVQGALEHSRKFMRGWTDGFNEQ